MKYEIIKTDTVKSWDDKTLYRIKRIETDEKGGYIEHEGNLSQDGDAWVSDNARVFGNALVYGNARVFGDALVYGNARVYGKAYHDAADIVAAVLAKHDKEKRE